MRAFIARAWLSSTTIIFAKAAIPILPMISLKSFMSTSLRPVATDVNTARSVFSATLCSMRDEEIRKAQGARLAKARRKAGFKSARAAALENGWPESSYRAHESGSRTIGQDDAERYASRFRRAGVQIAARDILFGDASEAMPEQVSSTVKVVGYIGAGARVEPEYEQVPEDGLETIDLPFSVPNEIVAFRVKGESMRPAYRVGDAVLVWRDQRLATENYVGEEAAVRTSDGRRFLKEIQRGSRKGTYDLYSHNDSLIEGVKLAWVGELYGVVKARQLRQIAAAQGQAEIPRRRRGKEATA